MDYGSLFGGVGSIAGAFINANATSNATQMQIDALNQQRQFVYNNLDPNVVNASATAADQQNAQARLALQMRIDPSLAAIRPEAGQMLQTQLGNLGVPGTAVAGAATSDALSNIPGSQASQNALIDAAMQNLKEGATLPPDLQNELVQAGLEKSGMVTGSSSGKGVGGQILRTILGSAGVQLQAQRQSAAASLMNTASGLETQRQSILQQLFPSLTAQQLNTMQGTAGALSVSNAMQPNAGLTGSQVANIWMSRVGATNQLAQSAAQTAAQGTMAQGQIWNNAIGSATGNIGRSGLLNQIMSPSGTPSPSYTPNAWSTGSPTSDWSNPANWSTGP
jgi:hypothetical protein